MDFKKTLAVTTALSAVALLAAAANPAFAAEKPKLTLYGYMDTYMGGGLSVTNNGTASDGTPQYNGGITGGTFNILQQGELRVKATGMTDSGMKWGAYAGMVQDNADAHSGKRVSTHHTYVWLEGTWGKLELGGPTGAYRMQRSADRLHLLGGNMLAAFVHTRGIALRGAEDRTNMIHETEDAKVNYFTPRVSGFQLGVTWIPVLGTQGTLDRYDAKAGGFESAISYKGKVQNTKYEVTAGYVNEGKTAVTNKTRDGWQVGGLVHVGAIGFGAGYVHNKNYRGMNIAGETSGPGPAPQSAGHDNKQHAWDIGANYNGGRWEASLIYLDSKMDFDAGGSEKYHQISLEGAYNLGGGLTAALGLYNFKDAAYTSSHSNKGTAVISKLTAKF